MKIVSIAVGTALAVIFAVTASPGWAAAKPAAGKPAPSCAALAFRPVPAGTSDGEQTAGMYRSRFAKLELRASVQNGRPPITTSLPAAPAFRPRKGCPKRRQIVQP